jgi:hypothetical protein
MYIATFADHERLIHVIITVLPSGKRLHNYGKITIFHGTTHYFHGHFQ